MILQNGASVRQLSGAKNIQFIIGSRGNGTLSVKDSSINISGNFTIGNTANASNCIFIIDNLTIRNGAGNGNVGAIYIGTTVGSQAYVEVRKGGSAWV